MSPRTFIFLVTIAVAGCGNSLGDDDDSSRDLSMRDQNVSIADMTTCQQNVFSGFPGTTATERKLECPCGCLIDSLEHATSDNLWAITQSSAMLTDTGAGLAFEVDGDASPATVSLDSIAANGVFYVENDFDLQVDYALPGSASGGAVLMRVDLQDGTFYEIARSRTTAGVDQYSSTLAGQAAAMGTAAMSGTLRIQRLGNVVTVFGDTTQVAQLKTAESTRVAVELGVLVSGCPGASPDAGSACTEEATLHNVRLAAGALVDRL